MSEPITLLWLKNRRRCIGPVSLPAHLREGTRSCPSSIPSCCAELWEFVPGCGWMLKTEVLDAIRRFNELGLW